MRGAGRWLLLLAIAQLFGCELIADFDRGKIPGAGTADANFEVHDAGAANGGDDAGDTDAGAAKAK